MKTAHHRFAVAILALLVLPVPAWGADPIKAELDATRKVYADTVAAAKATLLKAYDDGLKKIAAKGDLDGYKALKADKRRVERGYVLPESHPMRKHQVSFNKKLLLANKALARALDSAVKKYTMDLQVSMATAVQAKLKMLLKRIKAEETIEKYSRRIERDPMDFIAWHNRGNAYDDKGDYDQAIKDCSEAIKLKPDYAAAWYNRGLAYHHKGDYDQAIKDYSEAIKLNPEEAQAWCFRGRAYYFQKGNNDQAIKDLSEAIKLNPEEAQAWACRGSAYFLKGNYDQAIKDYNETIKLTPDAAVAWYNRGLAYKALGNTAKAEADFKKAEELGYRS